MENQNQPPRARLNVTPETMKGFKTLTCDCGGMLFQSGLVLKKLSALITPSGKEELYPIEVLICKACGKVPNELNNGNVLPDQILATPVSKSSFEERLANTQQITESKKSDKSSNLNIVK